MALSVRTKVAVLRGGPSAEYEVSLKSGARVLSLLRDLEHYEPIDLFISREGEWHRDGLSYEPNDALRRVDVVWNAMHGAYGEDGKVQQLLEALNIPYTGSTVLGSALAMNKDLAKQLYSRHALLTPRHEVLMDTSHERLLRVFRSYLHPVIVKPANSGSSIGTRLAHSFRELEEAVAHALQYGKKALVEEFIRGKEATCGVVEKGRGENLYAFIPASATSAAENAEITRMAKTAHDILGLRHYSSSDFVITPRGRIYILETDALPAMHEDSHLHLSLHATGWHPKDFIDHCLKLALDNKV